MVKIVSFCAVTAINFRESFSFLPSHLPPFQGISDLLKLQNLFWEIYSVLNCIPRGWRYGLTPSKAVVLKPGLGTAVSLPSPGKLLSLGLHPQRFWFYWSGIRPRHSVFNKLPRSDDFRTAGMQVHGQMTSNRNEGQITKWRWNFIITFFF